MRFSRGRLLRAPVPRAGQGAAEPRGGCAGRRAAAAAPPGGGVSVGGCVRRAGERCCVCVILSTLHSGSSHEPDTFCLLCFVSIGRRSGYCCRKRLLFLCSADQLFSPRSPAEFQWVSPSPPSSCSRSLMRAVWLAGNPRRRLIAAAPSNTNSWDSSVAFADVY